ncbi:MAG: 16S rRNA (cytidine(1402)-2'-O)-methyltransferase [Lachnospiraceae bacterium]|nr:16S rRNA (cytidine(1402)-2'-O)-methyltransferase [Lachnospiraceae bacterium]
MAGMLYLVATPIGNLEDMTYRAVRVLKEVDLIAAEDTRNSIKLLTHFDIHTPMTSYHEFNKYDKADYLVGEMLAGKNVAVITDAGTPGISDPGYELVVKAREAGIGVTAVPGCVAATTALTISGLPTRRFVFEGFLPTEKKEMAQVLDRLKGETRTIIMYEAPHRLKKTLGILYDALGDRRICLCRELTKKHEEGRLSTMAELIAFYENNDPKGECVLVIDGVDERALKEKEQMDFMAMDIHDHMAFYENQGIDHKEAMKLVAKDRGIGKRDVYQLLLDK